MVEAVRKCQILAEGGRLIQVDELAGINTTVLLRQNGYKIDAKIGQLITGISDEWTTFNNDAIPDLSVSPWDIDSPTNDHTSVVLVVDSDGDITMATGIRGGARRSSICTAPVPDEVSWSYTGPYLNEERWFLEYQQCGGIEQSPVDIPDFVNLENYTGAVNHVFSIVNKTAPVDFMVNRANPHTLEIVAISEFTITLHQRENTYSQDFILEQIHFHWADNDELGSEHTLDTRSFPLEAHLVTRRTDFTNISDALNSDDRAPLMVVGFLTNMDSNNDEGMNYYNVLASTLNATDNFTLDVYDMFFKFLEDNENVRGFSYLGSLTTPPCDEKVFWSVYQDHQQNTTGNFMNYIRGLTDDDGKYLSNNFRRTQPFNFRQQTNRIDIIP